jgi:hypothetical protein
VAQSKAKTASASPATDAQVEEEVAYLSKRHRV